MKKIVMMLGGVGVVVLLILAMFSTIVNAQTVKSNDIKTSIFQNIKDKITNNTWQSGEILILFIVAAGNTARSETK